MIFIETPLFTKVITTLLSDDDYTALQRHLIQLPDAGDIIQGTGGARKIRWSVTGQRGGKSGGIRVIYFFKTRDNQIYLLLAYPKGKQDNLTDQQKAIVKMLIKEL